MNEQIITANKIKALTKAAIACLLLLTTYGNLFAQYKGSPVTKERLISVLRSKQLPTRDIVATLKSNGANFRLTPNVNRELVAAGARPEVIEAVRNNYRKGGRAPAENTYNDLIEQAIYSYDNRKDTQSALNTLQRAIRLESRNPRAYQLLGFMNLYGLIDFAAAERNWQTAIALGGNAVFRVFHDHTGKFTDTCRGSLYISRSIIAFESDNNVHTFNTSIANVDEIKIDSSSTPLFRDKHSTYKIILRAGDDHAKFRFAPVTGNKEESKMVERLIRWKY